MLTPLLTPIVTAAALNAGLVADAHADVWVEMRTAAITRSSPGLLAQHPPPADLRLPGPPQGPGPDEPLNAPSSHWLRDLELSEAQQDRVFALVHAAMPAQRDAIRARFKAVQALRAMARSEAFDDTRASQLSAELARNDAALALQRARIEAAIWQILTPEQRRRAAETQARGFTPGFAPRPLD